MDMTPLEWQFRTAIYAYGVVKHKNDHGISSSVLGLPRRDFNLFNDVVDIARFYMDVYILVLVNNYL